jgi:pentose-5-phosphate-3-epimerase
MPDPQLFTNQHSQRFKIGLVINPDESFETISQTYNVQNIAAIQIMTVYPGAQGRPFEANALNFIDQLADMHYEGEIILDGAINDETLPQILKRQNKPTFIGPGSYFSKAQSPEEYKQKYEKLQTILREKTE